MELLIDRNLIFAQHQRIETRAFDLAPSHFKRTQRICYEYGKDEETTYYVFPTYQTQ